MYRHYRDGILRRQTAVPRIRSRSVLVGENQTSRGDHVPRRSRIVVAAVMSSSLLAGLAVSEPSGATTPDTTLPAAGDGPVGVIAIGHSGLTGENSDPDRPFQPALENSWATGTNPDVNSVYQRLVGVQPETEGHVANTAVGGGVSEQLPDQARTAMDIVPTPELVVIQTIDNDMVVRSTRTP